MATVTSATNSVQRSGPPLQSHNTRLLHIQKKRAAEIRGWLTIASVTLYGGDGQRYIGVYLSRPTSISDIHTKAHSDGTSHWSSWVLSKRVKRLADDRRLDDVAARSVCQPATATLMMTLILATLDGDACCNNTNKKSLKVAMQR